MSLNKAKRKPKPKSHKFHQEVSILSTLFPFYLLISMSLILSKLSKSSKNGMVRIRTNKLTAETKHRLTVSATQKSVIHATVIRLSYCFLSFNKTLAVSAFLFIFVNRIAEF